MIEQVQVLDHSGKVIREITVNQRIVLLNLETHEAGFNLLRVNMEGRIETIPSLENSPFLPGDSLSVPAISFSPILVPKP